MSEKDDIVDALTQVSESKLEFVNLELEYEKMSIYDIIHESKNIDTKKAANEVIQWLVNSVPHYIDNKEKAFRIDLVIDEDSEEEMGSVKKLQDLYRAVPEDYESLTGEELEKIASNFEELGSLNVESDKLEAIVQCRRILDDVTEKVHEEINNSPKIEELFDAMIYFYEMIGINRGQPLLRKLKGGVAITEFQYEAFSVGVKVLQGFQSIDEDMNAKNDKKVVNQYIIPEGFSLLLELSYRDLSRSRGVF